MIPTRPTHWGAPHCTSSHSYWSLHQGCTMVQSIEKMIKPLPKYKSRPLCNCCPFLLMMIMMTMMMMMMTGDFLTMLIFNKNTSHNTVYHSSYFIGMSVPCSIFNKNTSHNTVYYSSYFIGMSVLHGPPPFLVGMSSCPGCHLVLVFI